MRARGKGEVGKGRKSYPRIVKKRFRRKSAPQSEIMKTPNGGTVGGAMLDSQTYCAGGGGFRILCFVQIRVTMTTKRTGGESVMLG